MIAADGQIAVSTSQDLLCIVAVVDHGGGIGSGDRCPQTIVGTLQCQSGIARKSLRAVEGGALGHGHGAVSDGTLTVKDQLTVSTVVESDSGFVGHNTCVCSIICPESSGSGGLGKLVEVHIGAAAHDTVNVRSARNAEIRGKSMVSGNGQIAVAAAENGGVCAVGHGGEHGISSIGKGGSFSGSGAVEFDFYRSLEGLCTIDSGKTIHSDVVVQVVVTTDSQIGIMTAEDLSCIGSVGNAAGVGSFISTEFGISEGTITQINTAGIAVESDLGRSGEHSSGSKCTVDNEIIGKFVVAGNGQVAVSSAEDQSSIFAVGDGGAVSACDGTNDSRSIAVDTGNSGIRVNHCVEAQRSAIFQSNGTVVSRLIVECDTGVDRQRCILINDEFMLTEVNITADDQITFTLDPEAVIAFDIPDILIFEIRINIAPVREGSCRSAEGGFSVGVLNVAQLKDSDETFNILRCVFVPFTVVELEIAAVMDKDLCFVAFICSIAEIDIVKDQTCLLVCQSFCVGITDVDDTGTGLAVDHQSSDFQRCLVFTVTDDIQCGVVVGGQSTFKDAAADKVECRGLNSAVGSENKFSFTGQGSDGDGAAFNGNGAVFADFDPADDLVDSSEGESARFDLVSGVFTH